MCGQICWVMIPAAGGFVVENRDLSELMSALTKS